MTKKLFGYLWIDFSHALDKCSLQRRFCKVVSNSGDHLSSHVFQVDACTALSAKGTPLMVMLRVGWQTSRVSPIGVYFNGFPVQAIWDLFGT